MRHPHLIAAFLLAGSFALAVSVEPKLVSLPIYKRHDKAPLQLVLGDSRKLFANHIFSKADAYFHSGYYPSIFDNRESAKASHMVAGAGAIEDKSAEHEVPFLGNSRDIIERFGRSFFPSQHSHLDEGGASREHSNCDHEDDSDHDHDDHESSAHETSSDIREILPWLRLSAELDPQRVETYVVGSYWLRSKMGKVAEAEVFLRDGLKENPGDFTILFELGRILYENHHDVDRARNVWTSALKRWNDEAAAGHNPDTFLCLQLCTQLANLELKEGNPDRAVEFLQQAKAVSPFPETVQARINEARQKQRASIPVADGL